jgi:hypothetical protein
MSENQPEEVKESTEGEQGAKPGNQTGPPVVTITVKVHWPGNP